MEGNRSATILQAHWRGYVARRQLESMSEEAAWILKGFFDYVPTSRDCVRCQVQFFANPGFQGYRHFREFGAARLHDLDSAMADMQGMVDGAADAYLTREEREREEARLAKERKDRTGEIKEGKKRKQ